MSQHRYLYSLLLLFVFSLAGCLPVEATGSILIEPTHSAPAPDGTTLVLGVISGEPSETIKERLPFVNYLVTQLADQGVTGAAVKVTEDMAEMGRWLKDGEVDFLFDSIYPTLIVGDISGAIPELYRQRDKEDKAAVFFATTESGLTSLADLQGQMLVLEEPDSTSGYLLPVFYLLEAGLHPVIKDSRNSPVAADEIGILFSGDDDGVVEWVLAGFAPAGVAQDNVYQDFAEENGERLHLILQTETIMRDQPVLIRSTLDLEIRQALIAALINMEDHPAGQALLAEMDTRRFTPFAGARQADLARAQEMYRFIKDR